MNITGITLGKHLKWSGLILGLIGVVSVSLSLTACNTGYYGDWSPAWSPDGTKIAFYSTRGGEWAFYVMNADGSKQTNLKNSAGGLNPAWSPDGTKIVYSRNGQIYVMNADSSKQINLTKNSAGGLNPAWSPDGAMIAFHSNRTGDYEIYAMNVDGSNQVNLTQNPARDTEPTWAPDGTRIAFVSDRGGDQEIYVMNADGTDPTDLIDSPATTTSPVSYSTGNRTVRAVERYPAWSPDGTLILFCHPRYSWLKSDIYVVNADGTNLKNLTPGEKSFYTSIAVTTGITWSPDGAKIAHARYRAGFESMYVEIYVMDADGSNSVCLTHKSDVGSILSLIGKIVGPPIVIVLLIIWLRRRRRRAVSSENILNDKNK